MGERLVGREHELRLLQRWSAEAHDGTGRVVLISGEAGIGKSALVAAFARSARQGGVRTLVGRTTEMDGAPPHWPWRQILEQAGAPRLFDAATSADPEAEQFARLETMTAELSAAPTIVVVEDAHRADPASLRALTYLADGVAERAMLVVVTFRSERSEQTSGFATAVDGLSRLDAARPLLLAGIGQQHVAELLAEDTPPPTAAAVWALSNGNPLLVCELARHLAAGATVDSVPRSLSDRVRVRLAQRSAACDRAVRVAAVAGRDFAAGLVATAVGRPALEVLAALDEAIAAAIIEPGDGPGRFRFVHALVREAVLTSMDAAELATRHRDVAVALEAYEADTPTRTLELARLWQGAAVLGQREVAARWCARAGAAAEGQLAWEDAARLYERALELGAVSMSPIEEHECAVGAARALAGCGDATRTAELAARGATAARRAGRADLCADAVLVLEGRAVPSAALFDHARWALHRLDADAHALRARLHAQATNMAFYSDPTPMETHVASAEREARQTTDPLAELAAVRARQMLCYGPEHAEHRLELAGRLGRAARAARRPSIEIWEPLWRIDALVELGRLGDAVATVPALKRAVTAAGAPIARWHQARVEAALALAFGEFPRALQHADSAKALFARLEHPVGAELMSMGFRTAVGLHTGASRELAEAWSQVDFGALPPFLGDLPLLGAAVTAIGVGDVERAQQAYRQLPPVRRWQPPPALWTQLHALRIHAAAGLGAAGDLGDLYDSLLAHRKLHVGSGGGIVTYSGPVELWLGIAAAGLDRLDVAVEHLHAAVAAARHSGAQGFLVHAAVELAATLLSRDAPADTATARRTLAEARPLAIQLGMAPFGARIEALVEQSRRRDAGSALSPRESEVAALVAAGCTNRDIARQLYISERTAQNHVQHILTKLGFDNRTQIATWYRELER